MANKKTRIHRDIAPCSLAPNGRLFTQQTKATKPASDCLPSFWIPKKERNWRVASIKVGDSQPLRGPGHQPTHEEKQSRRIGGLSFGSRMRAACQKMSCADRRRLREKCLFFFEKVLAKNTTNDKRKKTPRRSCRTPEFVTESSTRSTHPRAYARRASKRS